MTREKTLSRIRRHHSAHLVVIAFSLLFVAVIWTALSTQMQTAKAAVSTETSVQFGKSLFAEGCSSCHGLQGEGSTDGPSLIGVGAAAVDFQVSSGRMPMATQSIQAMRKEPVYSEEEIAALAAYVASFGPGPAIPTDEQIDYTGSDIGLGGELFRVNCAQCHNFAGQGGALTEGKYAPHLDLATPRQIYEAMLTGPQNMPVFSEESLTPDEKRAIIAYIMALREVPNAGGLDLGRYGPVTEGLFAWTFGLGVLIALAIWIGIKAK